MVCPHCGATSDEGQRFCYNCGARIESQPAAGAQQPGAFPPPPAAVLPPQQEQGLPPAPAPLQYGSYQQPGGYVPQAIPNSTLAIVSLVCGIVSWVVLPVLAGIAAVITGHMARNEIRQSGGRVSGDGLALIGLVLGYANLAVAALGVCAMIAFIVLAAAA